MEKKVNIAIFSLNGTILVPQEKFLDNDITESLICKEFFKSDNLDDIRFTRINSSSYEDMKDLNEDIRIYYSSSKTDIWNYNPIISAYVGEMVYSSILVFVADHEMEDSEEKESMDHETFKNLVSGFVALCQNYLQSVMIQQTKKEKDSKKSPLFKMSSMKFYAAQSPEFTIGGHVDFGKDGTRLDEIWKKYYAGKYFQDFIFECFVQDLKSEELSSGYLLMKPSMMTLYTPHDGEISIYMTQYTRPILEKIAKKIVKIDDKLDEDKIKEEKEKIMKPLYS